jgi:hypothetical protein
LGINLERSSKIIGIKTAISSNFLLKDFELEAEPGEAGVIFFCKAEVAGTGGLAGREMDMVFKN